VKINLRHEGPRRRKLHRSQRGYPWSRCCVALWLYALLPDDGASGNYTPIFLRKLLEVFKLTTT
jgi:hypothetical protein